MGPLLFQSLSWKENDSFVVSHNQEKFDLGQRRHYFYTSRTRCHTTPFYVAESKASRDEFLSLNEIVETSDLKVLLIYNF